MKTVNDVSRMTGVSIRTLHHYDAIGLLKPTQITDAGYRLYDGDAIEKLFLILLFKEIGFPLKDIQSIDYSWDRIDFEIQPMNRMLMAKECADEEAGFDIDIAPDDIDVSDTVTVLWEIG